MGDSLLTMLRSLKLRRGRERRGLALAEGIRLVEEGLAAGVRFRGAAVAPSLESTPRGSALKAALGQAGVPLLELEERELVALADTEHPQGIVAALEPVAWTGDDLPAGPSGTVVVLDGVQDPGNVGAILRTAHGLGAGGVVALPGTVELTNPKVLRGAMGSSFRLPAVALTDEELLAWLARTGAALWVSAADGEPLAGRGGAGALALVVGNEGAGVRPALASAAARRVAIPLVPGAESLNVAVAAGILLWEVMRER